METRNIESSLNRRVIFIFLIIIFLSITIIQITNISIPAPNGYIPDIYDYFPVSFWILVLVTIVIGGIILAYYSAYNINTKSYVLIVFSLFLVIFTLFLQNDLLFFFTGRGDPLSHLGLVKDILSYGFFEGNKYPITHIFIASIVNLSNISPIKIFNYVPLIFYSLYFLSMVSLGKLLFKNNFMFYYFIGIASLPIFGTGQGQFWPNMALIFITPLVIYILIKCLTKPSKKHICLLIIILLYISYGHPLISLLWVVLLTILYLFTFWTKKYPDNIHMPSTQIIASIILLLALFYYINFLDPGIQHFFKFMFNTFLGGDVSLDVEILNQFSRIRPETSFFKIIRIAIFNYGTYAIFATISGIIFFYLVIGSIVHHKKFNSMLVLFATCSIALYVIALIAFMSTSFSISRIYNVGHVFTIVLIPLFFSRVIKNKSHRKTCFSFMVILFIILAVISVFTIQYSNYSGSGNEQVSELEYNAMETFHKYRSDIPFVEFDARTGRFYHGIYGLVEANRNHMMSYFENKPKSDLGYSQSNTFAQSYGSNIYFIDSRLQYYSKIYPEMLKLLLNDGIYLIKLNNDKTVSKIYSDLQTNIYYVKSTQMV